MEDAKKEFELIMKIVARADQLKLMYFDRVSLSMDLEIANTEFNLKLEDFLNADNHNFYHDIIGIQNNINRSEKKMDNLFVPRFASN